MGPIFLENKYMGTLLQYSHAAHLYQLKPNLRIPRPQEGTAYSVSSSMPDDAMIWIFGGMTMRGVPFDIQGGGVAVKINKNKNKTTTTTTASPAVETLKK